MSLLICLASCLMASFHPIRISVSEIHYNNESKKLETVIRVFYDDLEENLSVFHGQEIVIDEVNNRNEKLIAQYVKEKVEFKSQGRPIEYQCLGFEIEEDVIWIYLESEPVEGFNNLTVKNEILMDVIPEQKNIIHLKYQNEIKSYALTREQSTCQFTDIQSW